MSQPKREPINRYRPLTQGEARALGGGLMRVPTKEEANKGDYVEYSEYQQLAADHAALVQQGIRDHADWRSKLNFLEADYKAEIARLTAEKKVETRATFDAIRTITQLRDDYAALAAENERLKAIIVDECYGSDAYRKHENEAKRLTAENERLRKAGDAMAESIKFDDQRSWEDWGNQGKSLLRDCVIDWIIAKRGDEK